LQRKSIYWFKEEEREFGLYQKSRFIARKVKCKLMYNAWAKVDERHYKRI